MATTNVEHTADKVMIPSLEILQDVLAVAVDASRAAGAIIREAVVTAKRTDDGFKAVQVFETAEAVV